MTLPHDRKIAWKGSHVYNHVGQAEKITLMAPKKVKKF